MARTDQQINFRIPAALKERLDESARANNRSLTAELVARLDRPSSIEQMQTAMNMDSLRVRYELARMGLNIMRVLVTSAINEASESVKESASFERLTQALAAMPNLPESEKLLPRTADGGAVANLGKLADELNGMAKTVASYAASKR